MRSGADVVVLPGQAMLGLVRAVAALGASGIARYAVVGGIAVTARLGHAHRATSDVDAVVDETVPPEAVAALLELPETEVTSSAAHRVLVHGTKVEFLPVAPLRSPDLLGLSPTQALFAAAHWWALDTATPMTLVAGVDHSVIARAPFATPAALIAMKLHAIENRGATSTLKRAGDAWDMYRLLVDLDADGSVREGLAGSFPELRRLVRDAANRVLVDQADQTRAWLRGGDDVMAAITAADLRYVGRLLVDALE